jgi:RimJ/RimL family protein N-acetyltransferase
VQTSGKVLLKNGFEFESKKKSAYIKDGKLLNGLMYAKFKEK